MQAARLLARGELLIDGGNDDANIDGVPPEQLADFGLVASGPVRREGRCVFWLWPENELVFSAWLDLSTQWRSAGMDGVRCGLDYTAALALVQRKPGLGGKRARWRCFEGLRAMEAAALQEWAEQRARQRR